MVITQNSLKFIVHSDHCLHWSQKVNNTMDAGILKLHRVEHPFLWSLKLSLIKEVTLNYLPNQNNTVCNSSYWISRAQFTFKFLIANSMIEMTDGAFIQKLSPFCLSDIGIRKDSKMMLQTDKSDCRKNGNKFEKLIRKMSPVSIKMQCRKFFRCFLKMLGMYQF